MQHADILFCTSIRSPSQQSCYSVSRVSPYKLYNSHIFTYHITNFLDIFSFLCIIL